MSIKSHTLILLAIVAAPLPSIAQSAQDDPLAKALTGRWSGQGTYDGNTLELTRTWTLELGGQFLLADMGVQMPNGGSFRIIAYWKPESDGLYRVLMLDELGRSTTVQGLREPSTGDIVLHMIDEDPDTGPAWRRSIYRVTGPNTYEELLFGATPNGWTPLAHFRFERQPNQE
jgi:hypothetical protein